MKKYLYGSAYAPRARSSGFALTDGIGHVGGAFGALFLPLLVASLSFAFSFRFIAITGLIAGILAMFGPRTSSRTLEAISA